MWPAAPRGLAAAGCRTARSRALACLTAWSVSFARASLRMVWPARARWTVRCDTPAPAATFATRSVRSTETVSCQSGSRAESRYSLSTSSTRPDESSWAQGNVRVDVDQARSRGSQCRQSDRATGRPCGNGSDRQAPVDPRREKLVTAGSDPPVGSRTLPPRQRTVGLAHNVWRSMSPAYVEPGGSLRPCCLPDVPGSERGGWWPWGLPSSSLRWC
jgi:hypothetical protein